MLKYERICSYALFLLAGFPAKEKELIRCADQFRKEFEEGLRKTVELADGIVSKQVLNSGEVVTELREQDREANHYLRILEHARCEQAI